MKKPTYKGKELLPLSVIDAARDGDSQAVDQVLRYYEGYINKLCTRTLYDPDGQPHVRVDEYMKRRLEIKLIHYDLPALLPVPYYFVLLRIAVTIAAIEVVDDAKLKISGKPIRFLFMDFNGTIISHPGSIFVRFPLHTASVPFG